MNDTCDRSISLSRVLLLYFTIESRTSYLIGQYVNFKVGGYCSVRVFHGTRGDRRSVAGIAEPIAVSIIDSHHRTQYSRPLISRVGIVVLQKLISAKINRTLCRGMYIWLNSRTVTWHRHIVDIRRRETDEAMR